MIQNIVFSGGGFKGWNYIGTIRALHELVNFDEIKNVAGTSIGSVYGLYYILGFDWRTLLNFGIHMERSKIFDYNLFNLIKTRCLMKDNFFYDMVVSHIKEKVNPGITFLELYNFTQKTFTVCCTNLSKSNIEYFNHITKPHVKVLDAIIASCCIPGVFPIKKIDDEYFVDGGISNNCPNNLFDDVFTLSFNVECSINKSEISEFELLERIMTFTHNMNKSDHQNIFYICDDKYKNMTLNPNQTNDDVFSMYMKSYNLCKEIIYNHTKALQ
jgi:NTE family protein